MNPEIASKINAIRHDRMHGASWLSQEALAVIKLTAEQSQAANKDEILTELKEVANELIDARPAMASIANAVSHFIYQVYDRAKEKDLDSLKDFVRSEAEALITVLEQAALKAAEKGAEVIEEKDKIMTCSYSSTVCRAFELAKLNGKSFEVLAVESKYQDKKYGAITAEELKGQGILAELIPDNAIRDTILKANKAMVGADSILQNGSLINGIPTYELASAAKEHNIPFYTICETTKFNIQSHFSLEPGFDNISPELITGIITEKGILKPSGVNKYIKEIRGLKCQLLKPIW
jgi:translation initiation factor 2B subunit (eIF-2B alpha/beta/delta family)